MSEANVSGRELGLERLQRSQRSAMKISNVIITEAPVDQLVADKGAELQIARDSLYRDPQLMDWMRKASFRPVREQ